jgi:hypothetical protein
MEKKSNPGTGINITDPQHWSDVCYVVGPTAICSLILNCLFLNNQSMYRQTKNIVLVYTSKIVNLIFRGCGGI